jgi:N-acetylmuramoyl-L-alanine amidase
MNKFDVITPADVPKLIAEAGRRIDQVFVHCSASDRPEHDSAEQMEVWHIQRGFAELGYSAFIKKDGTIQLGRAWSKIPAAQVGHNNRTLAICLHGLAKDKFTEAQFDSLRGLAVAIDDALAKTTGRPVWRGHAEVANKLCPVFSYVKVLNLNTYGELNKGPAPWTTTTPPEPPTEPQAPTTWSKTTLVIMDSGDAVRELQRLLNANGADITEDGYFGRETDVAVKTFQRQHKLVIDGVVGSQTWRALGV